MLRRFLAAALLFSASLLPSTATAQSAATGRAVDFVFLIDASPSMNNNITSVRTGMSNFVADLDAAGVDARFAIILFGKTGPELILDFTSDSAATIARLGQIVTNGASPGVHDDHNGDPEDSLAAIRAALGTTVTPLNRTFVGGTGRLSYRDGALINLILMTDENSDRPFYSADREAGQTGTEPPTLESNFQPSDWQVEVDKTADAVIEKGAFLNMLIDSCPACRMQYGNPAADVSDADLGNWDEDATLANLEDVDSISERSLQAQVIEAGLVARAFLIGRLANDAEPNFVNNFFDAKIEETLIPICGDGQITGDEECEDGNSVSGDCCSEDCVFEPVATPCTSDSNACTTDVCNATGTCLHNPITCAADGDPCTADTCDPGAGCNYPDATDGTTCNDGLFCTTTDTCTAGVCGGTGNACPGAECQATCSEGMGGPVCADPMGTPCTSDSDVCTDDVCNGSGACVHPFNSAPCEDGDECSTGDFCSGGVCQTGPGTNTCDDADDCTIDSCSSPAGCQHQNIQFFSACFGAIIAGDSAGKGQARVRDSAQALGNTCSDVTDLGQSSVVEATVFARDPDDDKAVKVRGNAASIGEDLLTGGGAVTAAPVTTEADLFGTGMSLVATGSTVDMPLAGVIDTTGMGAGLGDCLEAQQNLVPVATLLDNLTGDQSFGKLTTPVNGSRVFTAGNVGGVNVIDIGKWLLGNFATVTIDGGGAESTFVFRVDKKMDSNSGVQFLFTNGAAPERTIFYVKGGKLEIGQGNVGGGILFCPGGKTFVRAGTTWSGAMIAGKKADLRDVAVLTHVHYQGPNF